MNRSAAASLTLILVLIFVLAACGGEETSPTEPPPPTDAPTATVAPNPTDVPTDIPTIEEEIQQQGDFTILLETLAAAELSAMLDTTMPYTLFAPTDAAFEAFFASEEIPKEAFLDDTAKLTELLLYHLVEDVHATDTLENTVATLANGAQINVVRGEETGIIVLNNTAQVLMQNINASNGIIHVIDTVLTLPEAEPEATPEAEPETTPEAEATPEMTPEATAEN